MAKTLFISYSRADMVETDWIARLKMYLTPLVQAEMLDVWDDSRIKIGDIWRTEIDTALRKAGAAVLLVGPGFLASDFVMRHELPVLLEAASQRGTTLFPVVIGYCGYVATPLERYQAANDPNTPLESLDRAAQNKILNEIAMAINRILRVSPDSPGVARTASSGVQDKVIREIARALGDTRVAFEAQCRRRDGLVRMIETRLQVHSDMEYEKFFFKYYPQLNDAERFEFDQIRAITEGPLYRGNRRMVELLGESPSLIDEIPALVVLRQHLVFWLNKFEKVFLPNKAMCLLYIGVEDGVPFPSHIDKVVATRIASQTAGS